MKFDKFQSIVEYNRKNQEKITAVVRDFYYKMGMNYEKELLNIMMIIRPVFSKRNYIVLEMPFKDNEIGAVCYKGDGCGYMILNSAVAKVNENFALAHEIFHVVYQEKMPGKKIELYMNEHYLEYEEEMNANLFASILLMPAPGFIEMFNKFKLEQNEDDSDITIFCKLMSYFEVPYMAVLIRAYELQLLSDGIVLESLLKTDAASVKQEFSRLWLNDMILYPTRRNDYGRFEELIKKTGEEYIKEDLLDKNTVNKALANINAVYEEIRG